MSDIDAQLAYLRQQTTRGRLDIWLRVTSAGASFRIIDPSTLEVLCTTPPVEVAGFQQFKSALDCALFVAATERTQNGLG
jgi:hypothetical protein